MKSIAIITITKKPGRLILNTLYSLRQYVEHSPHLFSWHIYDSGDPSLEIDQLLQLSTILPIAISRGHDKGIYKSLNSAIRSLSEMYSHVIFIHAGDCLTPAFFEYCLLSNLCMNSAYYFEYDFLDNPRWLRRPFIMFARFIEKKLKYGLPSTHNSILYPTLYLKKYLYNLAYDCAADYEQFLTMTENGIKFIPIQCLGVLVYRNGFISSRRKKSYLEYASILKNRSLLGFIYWVLKSKLVKNYAK